MRARRVAARERERAIGAAVSRYLAQWQAITACEAKRDRDVAALREQISKIEDSAAVVVASHRDQQARIAAEIRSKTHSDEEVADLLEISSRQLRQHLAAVRNADTATAVDGRDSGSVSRTGEDPGGVFEERSVKRVSTARRAGAGSRTAAAPDGEERRETEDSRSVFEDVGGPEGLEAT